MAFRTGMRMRMRFFLNRLQERLWIKPLLYCLLSVAAAFFAGLIDHLAGHFEVLRLMPRINVETVRTLLSIIAASMLGMAVFAVGSMVSAFQAAGASATPRAFSLIIADDVSQKALSTFVGAFIFSVVGISALSNGYYDDSGHLVLFMMTLVVLLLVILRFLHWVDRIARLGRVGETIAKVEAATAPTLRALRKHPCMDGREADADSRTGAPIEAALVGYLQRIDMAELQAIAEREDLQLRVNLLPGSLVAPGRALIQVLGAEAPLTETVRTRIERAFVIGDKRTFDEDPRFGLVVLSQIASRALSPAVNDPGTAIDILGSQLRLFVCWARTETADKASAKEPLQPSYDRICVPRLPISELLENAFNAIARDGAALVEVAVRLQQVLHCLSSLPDSALRAAAIEHARFARDHAEQALKQPRELETLQMAARWIDAPIPPPNASA